MTDTARPAQTGRYRSVPPSGAYLMEWTGGVLFTLGQFQRRILSRLVQLKLSTTQVQRDTTDSARLPRLAFSNGIVAGSSGCCPGPGLDLPIGITRETRGRQEPAKSGTCTEQIMNHISQAASALGVFKSGGILGGKVAQYREKQKIYTQGEPAFTLFYIQHGGVRLTTRSKGHPSAVTAILGMHDFFGEVCLAGYPLRMSTAVAMTASTIRTISKAKMLQLLHRKNKTSNALVSYLLSSMKKYRDHVADLLTSNAEQRLARILLRLAHLEKGGSGPVEIPLVSHQVLAEMVGTTRPRVNLFMNRFRNQGYIHYDGTLVVNKSLRKAL